MLFIFRKLRRSFFQPGKVRTYVAYAAGEIVLIVVGILLALQISEWNEERKIRTQEQAVLEALVNELGSNVALIQTDLEQNRSFSEATWRWIRGNDAQLSGLEKMRLIYDVADYRTPEISTATMDGILGSEGDQILDDPDFLQTLRDLKNAYMDMEKHERQMIEFFWANIGEFFSQNDLGDTFLQLIPDNRAQFTTVDEAFLKLYEDPNYKSRVSMLETVRGGVISKEEEGLNGTLEVLSLIQE